MSISTIERSEFSTHGERVSSSPNVTTERNAQLEPTVTLRRICVIQSPRPQTRQGCRSRRCRVYLPLTCRRYVVPRWYWAIHGSNSYAVDCLSRKACYHFVSLARGQLSWLHVKHFCFALVINLTVFHGNQSRAPIPWYEL